MNGHIFFNGWEGIVRILVIAPAAYAALVVFLRVSGKRTLTKLNAFDLVITVALGSTLATAILSRQTPLLDGVLALGLLVLLQWVVTSLSIRWKRFRKLVRASPTVLVREGELCRKAMRRARLTEDEVLQGVRAGGGQRFEDALVVFLQTDGSLAAILK